MRFRMRFRRIFSLDKCFSRATSLDRNALCHFRNQTVSGRKESPAVCLATNVLQALICLLAVGLSVTLQLRWIYGSFASVGS